MFQVSILFFRGISLWHKKEKKCIHSRFQRQRILGSGKKCRKQRMSYIFGLFVAFIVLLIYDSGEFSPNIPDLNFNRLS